MQPWPMVSLTRGRNGWSESCKPRSNSPVWCSPKVRFASLGHYPDFLKILIGRGPRHPDACPRAPGLTVALLFLQRVSSVPRVSWGGGLRLLFASQHREKGVGRHG